MLRKQELLGFTTELSKMVGSILLKPRVKLFIAKGGSFWYYPHMSETQEQGDPLAQGREAYRQFSEMFDGFNLVSRSDFGELRSRPLEDQTTIFANKTQNDNIFQVSVRAKGKKDMELELREDGLTGIRLGKVALKIGNWDFRTENLNAGYVKPGGYHNTDVKAFRNSAAVIVGWVKDMIEQDKLIPPVSLVTLE